MVANFGRICKRAGTNRGRGRAGFGRMGCRGSWPSRTRTGTRIGDVAHDRTAAVPQLGAESGRVGRTARADVSVRKIFIFPRQKTAVYFAVLMYSVCGPANIHTAIKHGSGNVIWYICAEYFRPAGPDRKPAIYSLLNYFLIY